MKTSISILIFITSLCLGCSRDRGYSSRSLSSASTQTALLPPSPEPIPAPTVTKKSNTAIVISPHANLRQYDNGIASVLEVVPQDASVEVIKQQGAWFLIKTETNQGWMHGNTIRLQNFNIEPQVKSKPPKIAPKLLEDVPESSSDSSADTYRNSATREYITGPRGGCYYINSNGNRTYVDRSMCGGSNLSERPVITTPTSSSSRYIRGPRGGCYYINSNGNKTYVDRSLCD